MTKRVLVTGIGGSIGCHFLCHIMHKTDWEVIGLDSFRHKGLTDRVAEVLKAHEHWRQRLTIYSHDLSVPFSPMLISKMGRLDYMINLASLSDVHASIKDPAPFIQSNVQLQITMVELARIMQPEIFLQISTDEVYGPTDGSYFHEEWDAIVPSNPYSASKASQEAISIAYWRTYGLPLIIVNLMNNFGEMQNPAKFPAIVQRKVRAGEPITIHGNRLNVGSRYYIHSRNSADAVLFIMHHVKPYLHRDGTVDRPERFNIVGDRKIANDELAHFIAGIIGKPAHLVYEDAKVTRPGHDAHYGLDPTKLYNLGWRPPVSLEDSMAETVRWYEEHPQWLER